MGEVLLAAVIVSAVTAGVGVYQAEEQKDQAREIQKKQEEADRKADITSELQRERDVAEREKEKNLLPPIIGSADRPKAGIDALVKKTSTGVQTGTATGTESGVQI